MSKELNAKLEKKIKQMGLTVKKTKKRKAVKKKRKGKKK